MDDFVVDNNIIILQKIHVRTTLTHTFTSNAYTVNKNNLAFKQYFCYQIECLEYSKLEIKWNIMSYIKDVTMSKIRFNTKRELTLFIHSYELHIKNKNINYISIRMATNCVKDLGEKPKIELWRVWQIYEINMKFNKFRAVFLNDPLIVGESYLMSL
jgi:hypothetical protein